MGRADEAFDLLTVSDPVKARVLAERLEHINNERKGVSASLSKEVKKRVKALHKDAGQTNVIVMGNPEWKPAMLGPVANTLVEEFNVPVFLWGRAANVIKGSCRGPKGMNLVKIMMNAPAGTFMEFGGHSGSGGFSVREEMIHTLENTLSETIAKMPANEEENLVDVDDILSLDDVSWDTFNNINKLAPFGMDNAKPVFLFKNSEVAGIKAFGKEKNHMEIILRSENGNRVKGIAFFMAPEDFEKSSGKKISAGSRMDVVANIEKSVFGNRPEIRLRIIDIL